MNKIERDRTRSMEEAFEECVEKINELCEAMNTLIGDEKCGKPIYVDVGDGMTCANPKGQCILHDVKAHQTQDLTFQANYHPIEHILNDFKNGATYSDSIAKMQRLIDEAIQDERARLREAVVNIRTTDIGCTLVYKHSVLSLLK